MKLPGAPWKDYESRQEQTWKTPGPGSCLRHFPFTLIFLVGIEKCGQEGGEEGQTWSYEGPQGHDSKCLLYRL